jgi:hypothetical protein
MTYRKDLQTDEYESYFKIYLDLIDPDAELFETLEQSLEDSTNFLHNLERPLDYSYAAGKWTIGEVIQHNIDTERVFQYRALRFLRGDSTALAGFDQDLFVEASRNIAFAKAELSNTLRITRENTIALFKEASPEQLKFKGTASGKVMTARVLPFLIAGHNKHHERIIAQRY